MRHSRNDQVVKWIRDTVAHDYADDIDIVALYGSYINGTANPLSDVDTYFIPATDKANQFCQTFIIEGVGYDIFPMTWERVAELANFNESIIPCLGNAEILYSTSKETAARFKALQKTLKANLSNQEFMRKRARERYLRASQLHAELLNLNKMSAVRTHAGYLLMMLAEATAYENQTYFQKGTKKQFDDLQTLERLPDDFLSLYIAAIATASAGEIKTRCAEILENTRVFLNYAATSAAQPVSVLLARKPVDYQVLAAMYMEMSSTFNKIYVCCEAGNAVLAYLSAVSLQSVFDDIAREFEFVHYESLLEAYDFSDLRPLKAEAKAIEADLVKRITDGGGVIKRYASFEAFQNAHS